MKPTRAAAFPKANGCGWGDSLILDGRSLLLLGAGKRCPGGVHGPDDLSPTLPWCPEGQPRWESQVAKRLLHLRNLNSLLARGC